MLPGNLWKSVQKVVFDSLPQKIATVSQGSFKHSSNLGQVFEVASNFFWTDQKSSYCRALLNRGGCKELVECCRICSRMATLELHGGSEMLGCGLVIGSWSWISN